MKSILKLLLLFFSSVTFSQTNLLDTSTWTVGSGSVSGFNKYGLDVVNIREADMGPHGTTEIIWKRASGIDTTSSGGWITDNINIDHTKSYRFSVWIKKTNSNDGRTFFGFNAKDSVGNNTGAYKLNEYHSTNAYFWVGDIPSLNNWYLLVAYIYESTYAETTNIGGIYDLSTGNKALGMDDFKFNSTTTQLASRTFLYDETNIHDSQYFFDPRIYEINGLEPTVEELLEGPLDSQSPSISILSSTTQTDSTVDLSWTAATDNVAVTGYKIYKDDIVAITLGNILSYQVTGLSANTQYNFKVAALDAAGNESIVSNTVTITTNPSSGEGPSYWTLNNQNVYYTNGNVGIGTSIPDSKLTVKGTIHSEEVKIDLSVPAPDYVFEVDYNLTSLDKLQEYIKIHGHLPNIPSAKEMETHGIELGIMNMKLLEKIEELILYMLMQESRIKDLEGNIKKNK